MDPGGGGREFGGTRGHREQGTRKVVVSMMKIKVRPPTIAMMVLFLDSVTRCIPNATDACNSPPLKTNWDLLPPTPK